MPESSIVRKSKFPAKVMVWAGVAQNFKSNLIIIPGNMNSENYINYILKSEVVPKCRLNNFLFQQDGATSHTARKTIEYLRSQNIDFIDPSEWPPNSPDINPMDYGIWSVL